MSEPSMKTALIKAACKLFKMAAAETKAYPSENVWLFVTFLGNSANRQTGKLRQK